LSNPENGKNAKHMKEVITDTNGLQKAVDLLEQAFRL
jgi:hypothetical protein